MYNFIYGMGYPGLGISAAAMFFFVILALWDAAWKAVGLWKSGTQRQLVWFIFIFIFNTAGILPIVYLLWFQKDKKLKSTNLKSKRRK